MRKGRATAIAKVGFALLVLAISGLLATHDLYAAWAQANGPGGNGTIAIASCEGGIFAATYNAGIFRSTNNGKTWFAVNNGLPSGAQMVSLMASGGNLLVTIGREEGAFLSTNSGANWVSINKSFGDATLSSITFSLLNNAVILASVRSGYQLQLFRSTTNGLSWSSEEKFSDEIGQTILDGSVIFGASGKVIYCSTDNGAVWLHQGEILPNPDFPLINALCYREGVLLAATDHFGVFRSDDDGKTWIESGKGLPHDGKLNQNYAFVAINGNIFLGTSSGLFCSSNVGDLWTRVDNGFTNKLDGVNDLPVYTLAVVKGQVFAGTTGVYVSSDSGGSWTSSSVGLSNLDVTSFSTRGNNLYASAGGSGAGVYVQNDTGSGWLSINKGLSTLYTSAIHASESGLYVGAVTAWSGICRSTNDGASWISVSNGLPVSPFFAVTVIAEHKGMLLAGTNAGIFVSSDQGGNWISASNGLTNSHISALAFLGDTILAGSSIGVFLSTNSGESWIRSNIATENVQIYALDTSGGCLFAGSSKGLFATTNCGGTWTNITFGIGDTTVYALAIAHNLIFAGTAKSGIFMSLDHGGNWIAANDGLPFACVNELSLFGGCLYAGVSSLDSSGGVWKRPISEMLTTIDDRPSVLPADKLTISQNYPNPFNIWTTIEFDLCFGGHTTLKIYDVSGNEVATLLSGEIESGRHLLSYNGAGLANGTYFYRATTSGLSHTHIMSVMH